MSFGEKFMVIIGDCAESFDDCQQKILLEKCQFYELVGRMLEKGLQKTVIRVGRIAGQYCKPRSNKYEYINNQKVLSYKGDMINSFHDLNKRNSDLSLLKEAYIHSLFSSNFIAHHNKSNHTTHSNHSINTNNHNYNNTNHNNNNTITNNYNIN